MSALGSSSSSAASRRSCAGLQPALPARDPQLLQRPRAAPPAPHGLPPLPRPRRGALQVQHSARQQHPLLMKAMAGISAGVLMFQAVPALHPQPARAAATASLTEIQLHEAEKLYDLMRERTGKDLPRLSSSPNEQVQGGTRFVQAGQDAMISQLKSQLERMNQLLATEKQLVEADRLELNSLQQAIAKMRAAEAMAPVLAAPPVAAPPVQIQVEKAVPAAAAEDSNILSTVAIGGLSAFIINQNFKAKSAKDDLDSQLATERKRVAALEAQAAKMRAELAREQEMVAQLRQQMEMSEQRSRLTITSEKRQRDLAARANEQAKKSLEEERKRILATKFEVIAAREKAQAALAAKEQEMKLKMQQEIEREQQRSRLLVTSARREKMLEEQAGKATKQLLEAERKRVLATKSEVFAVRDRALATLAAKEQEMASKMEQAIEKEKQFGRLMLTSARRESMLAMRTNEEVKKLAETDRKRMLATKMEIIDVRERAHASLVAKEEELTSKMEQAVEKEKQMGRLWLTSAKRENMLAMRTNDEVKKAAETDRKRMLATKMEIIAVREKAHANLVAKEEEMTIKMEQAVEKEKQTGRLWLTSARRENMMAARANDELKKTAETDRKRMLATKMEIIDVRERAHATLVAKEEELTAKMEQAVEKEKQLGRLWLTSAKRENMMAARSNDELKKTAETDRKRMLATKMEIIDVRARAHANLVAKEEELTAKMAQAVEKEQQLGRLWLTSSKRENMLTVRQLEEAKQALDSDRKRMVAAKREAIAAREEARSDRLAREKAAAARLQEAIEREQQRSRLLQASARRENMLLQRDAQSVKQAAEADRKRLIAAKSDVLSTMSKAQADRVAIEAEMMAKMKAEVERVQQFGRLSVASERRQVVEARRAVAAATAALEAERKQKISARSEVLSFREQVVAERNEKLAAVAEVERLMQLVHKSGAGNGNGGVIAPKAVTAQDNKPNAKLNGATASLHKEIAQMVGTDTSSLKTVKVEQDPSVAIAMAEREAVAVQSELESAEGQVQAASSQIAAMQQQQEQREQLPMQLQAEIEAASKKEQLLKAQAETLRSLVADAAQDSEEEASTAQLQATLDFALRKASHAAASTSALRSKLADAAKSLAAATTDIKNAESARAESLRAVARLSKAAEQARLRVAELKAINQKRVAADAGYRSDEEEARNEVAELAEKAKLISLAPAVGSEQ